MKNFINLSDLNNDFKNLLLEKNRENVDTEKDGKEEVKEIMNKLQTGKTVTNNNTEINDIVSEEDDLYFIDDDTLNVDARKDMYDYPEDYLKKYEMKTKVRKDLKSCPNWEELEVKGVLNKPKIVKFRKTK